MTMKDINDINTLQPKILIRPYSNMNLPDIHRIRLAFSMKTINVFKTVCLMQNSDLSSVAYFVACTNLSKWWSRSSSSPTSCATWRTSCTRRRPWPPSSGPDQGRGTSLAHCHSLSQVCNCGMKLWAKGSIKVSLKYHHYLIAMLLLCMAQQQIEERSGNIQMMVEKNGNAVWSNISE